MEVIPTPEQQRIIDSRESALISAGPGTGKTTTAIGLALRRTGEFDPNERRQVLFLSFSRAAVFRLMEAANRNVPRGLRKRISYSTYHSLAAWIVRCYGRFIGLPGRIRIADPLEESMLSLEEAWSTDETEYLAKLRSLAVEEGVVAFDLLLSLAIDVLESNPSICRILRRRFPLIVVDEFQDTSYQQWSLLKLMGGTSQVVAFGDPNQIIYGALHDATRDRMHEFEQWKDVQEQQFSAGSFRFENQGILTLAEALLEGNRFN